MSYFKWAHSNRWNYKIFWKKKLTKFATKNALIGYFWARLLKKLLSHLKEQPQIFQIGNFRKKWKMSKFGTKNVWLGYSWAIILKKYCHILNQHPRICQIVKFCKKTRMRNLVAKIPFRVILSFHIFAEVFKSYCRILNEQPQICQIGKFCQNNKNY